MLAKRVAASTLLCISATACFVASSPTPSTSESINRRGLRHYEAEVQDALKEAHLVAVGHAQQNGGSFSDLETALVQQEITLDDVKVSVIADREYFCIRAVHDLLPDTNDWETAIITSRDPASPKARNRCPGQRR